MLFNNLRSKKMKAALAAKVCLKLEVAGWNILLVKEELLVLPYIQIFL